MALSYDTCVALRDAGFPQISYVGGKFWAPHTPRHAPEVRAYVEADIQDAGDGWLVCPNSDELLADAQRRLPGWEITLHSSSMHGAPLWWAAARRPDMQQSYHSDHTGADTPVAAIAALYLALAEAR